MPGEMIICVGIYADASPHRLIANLHPFLQWLTAVENRLVACFCKALDALAVAQPADVGEIGGNGVASLEPLRRSRRTTATKITLGGGAVHSDQ